MISFRSLWNQSAGSATHLIVTHFIVPSKAKAEEAQFDVVIVVVFVAVVVDALYPPQVFKDRN